MVAPKGLGPMVRREFVSGRGVPGLIASAKILRDAGRRRRSRGRKGSAARARVTESTFRGETGTDLFGEQAVLCGGMRALVRLGFETLVRPGCPPELAYLECLHELKFIVDLMHEKGISGMRRLIASTANWGDITVGPKILDRSVQKRIEAALRDIRSGKFAKGGFARPRADRSDTGKS